MKLSSLHIYSVLLIAAGFLITCALSQEGVCSRVNYRAVSYRASSTEYSTYSTTLYYKCGSWWRRRRRCPRAHYHQQSNAKYSTAYRTQSYTVKFCCEGYTGSPPECEPKTCPFLRNPSYGDVSFSSVDFNSVARYSCNIGYRMSGSSSRTCQADEQWSGSEPTCRAIYCSTPSAPGYGTVTYTSRRYSGVAHYSCNPGYRLSGSLTRTCQSNGQWSGSQPSCPRIRCPPLYSPGNGRVTITQGSRYPGSSATYSCNYGYKLVGSTSDRVCQINGDWTGSTPSCRRVYCPQLDEPRNGTMSMTSRTVGGVASFSCEPTHNIAGSQRLSCLASGQWSASEPDCVAKTCPIPRNPSYGDVDYNSRNLDSVAWYSCNVGYNLNGSTNLTCQADEQWSGSEPTCESVYCSTPRIPYRGSVTYTSTRYNDVAHYSCNNGYRLIGPVTQTCQSSGQWSRYRPYCQRIRCPYPASPANGSVSVHSRYPGGTSIYRCNYGFGMVGSSRRTCLTNGAWTGNTPTCKQIFCPLLDEIRNGTMNMTSNTVGGLASFSCHPTHYMVGSSQRVCQANGEWNGTQPECIERCIPSIGFELSYLRLEEGESKKVCLRTCSCYTSSNLTVELKTWRQDNELEQYNGLVMPEQITMNENFTCFQVTHPDNNLLEGFESVSIVLYKSDSEEYRFCQGSETLTVGLEDDDELKIGFENDSLEVDEDAGSVEICVVVHEPKNTVVIPDVVVNVNTFFFGGAKAGKDYNELETHILPLSNSYRRACFSLTIIDDAMFEGDEKLSLMVERNSTVADEIPIDFYPHMLTVTIMDNDGITLDFETYEMTVEEGSETEVCVKARFPSSNSDPFSIEILTKSLTTEAGKDYTSMDSLPLGPFSFSSLRQCFTLTVKDDTDVEKDEMFTLEIEEEPSHVIVGHRTVLVTIKDDDEPMPCDSFLRPVYPALFKHCTDCEYPRECSDWKEKPDSRVEVPKEICPSDKMCVKVCSMNATKGDNCEPKLKLSAECVPTTGEKLAKEIGAGNGNSRKPGNPQTTASPPRGRRSSDQAHCYEPQDALSLTPEQCNIFQSGCQYSSNQIRSRNPNAVCTNRSVLFVMDSSHSIGYDLFKDISGSLAHLVKHLCGDVQFGLMKYSSGAYLEFCFDCYANYEREKLQERILNTKYLGHSSFTGYAARCTNSFMFDGSDSCGEHEGRCIDLIFLTDGQSSDRAFINVCDQVECLHRNPHISDKLNIYVVNIGTSALEEAECITKYSNNLKNDERPIFNFDSIEDLIIELNTVIRLFSEDEHKSRESGKKPEYQCHDWLKREN